MTDICPGCQKDLTYAVGHGPEYSGKVTIEVPGVYDGGLFFAHLAQTGGCGAAWPRWSVKVPGERSLALKAKRYIDEWNAQWYHHDTESTGD
jgi:hypothetical protein